MIKKLTNVCPYCGKEIGNYTLCKIHYNEVVKEIELKAEKEFDEQLKKDDKDRDKIFHYVNDYQAYHEIKHHGEHQNETYDEVVKKLYKQHYFSISIRKKCNDIKKEHKECYPLDFFN
jgi:hypothetical protein